MFPPCRLIITFSVEGDIAVMAVVLRLSDIGDSKERQQQQPGGKKKKTKEEKRGKE